jgi:hypothetical protein
MLMSIKVSFQTEEKPSPLSITFLMVMKYHLDGTKLEKTCIGQGMFSIGNIKPVSSMVGNIMLINDVIMAPFCVVAFTEISNPIEREVRIKRILSKIKRKIFPLISNSSNVTLRNKIIKRFKIEISR